MADEKMEADGARVHSEVVKILKSGIGLVTFLRTPDELIHPVVRLETVLCLEKQGYSVDVHLVDLVLQHIRDTKSFKGL